MRTLVVITMLLVVTAAVLAGQEAAVRVRDLPRYVGQTVTVKGRTGNIVEALEGQGFRVFTLRDDYGDMVYVYSRLEYPIMGATYFITGQPTQAGGSLFLQELSRKRAYSLTTQLLALTAAVAVALGCVGLLWGLLRRVRPGQLWGYAEVVEGPADVGHLFAIRGEEVWIGRAVDPDKDICLGEEHTRVSRTHGRLFRRGGQWHYQDYGSGGSGSTYGSAVDGRSLSRGETVPLPAGRVRITLGGQTSLVIYPAEQARRSETEVAGLPESDRHERSTVRASDQPDRPPSPSDGGGPDGQAGGDDRRESPTDRA